jgi:hypothetical protein
MRDTEARKPVIRASTAISSRHLVNCECNLDVATDGHIEKRRLLEDGSGEASLSDAGSAIECWFVEQGDGASGEIEQKRAGEEESRFTGTVGAEDSEHITLGDIKHWNIQYLSMPTQDTDVAER